MKLALLLLACSSMAHAAEPQALGRLFHTPEERRALDQERNAADGDSGGDTGRIMVNGVVYRSSGEATVWINQQMQHQEKGTSAKPSDRVKLSDTSLRVGETASKGKVEDLLGPGAIRVIPPAP